MAEIIALPVQKHKSEAIRGPQILVVEDEALIALMVEDMLSALRCRVIGSARSVADALALLRSHQGVLDGAILDISLGGEKVYAVAEALQARDVPFVFATGYDADTLDERFAGYPTLAKPFEMLALEGVIREIFRRAA
ncbi:MAG: response regulator [Hyphomonadaceae bacterium]|nr:response regulator [Hyphomonadaceae bacterium]